MCEERAERSAVKEDEDEGIVAWGMMVSFWIVARRPRWVDEVMRVPRADFSSCDAACC